MTDADSTASSEIDASTHTSARMSARTQRIEVITRRRATPALVVGAEAGDRRGEPGAACVLDGDRAQVRDRHGPALYMAPPVAEARARRRDAAGFARVDAGEEPRRLARPRHRRICQARSGLIEIVLPGGDIGAGGAHVSMSGRCAACWPRCSGSIARQPPAGDACVAGVRPDRYAQRHGWAWRCWPSRC